MSEVSEDKDNSTKCHASDSNEDIQLVTTGSVFKMSQRDLYFDQIPHDAIPNVVVSPRKSTPKGKARGIRDGHPVALSPLSHTELGHILSTESTDSFDSRDKKNINNYVSPSKDGSQVSHLRSKLGKSISEGRAYGNEPLSDEHYGRVHHQQHHGLVNRVRSLSEDAVTGGDLEPEAASSDAPDLSPLSDSGVVDNIVHLEALSAFSFDAVDTGRVLSRSSSVDNHSSGSGSPRHHSRGHGHLAPQHPTGSPIISHERHIGHPVLAPLNMSQLHHHHQHHLPQHHHHGHHHIGHASAVPMHGAGHSPEQSYLHQGRPHPPFTKYHPHSSAGGYLVSKGLMDKLAAETQAETQRRADHRREKHFDGDVKKDDFQVHYKHKVDLIRDHYYEHNIVYEDEDEGTKDDDVYYY